MITEEQLIRLGSFGNKENPNDIFRQDLKSLMDSVREEYAKELNYFLEQYKDNLTPEMINYLEAIRDKR